MIEIQPQNQDISSVSELKARIAQLEIVRDEQEAVLRKNLCAVYESLQPAELLKSAIANIRSDSELKNDAGGLLGSMGINFLLGKLFRKNNSIGGYVKAMAAEQVVTFLYKKYEDKIHAFLGNITDKLFGLFRSDEDKESKEE